MKTYYFTFGQSHQHPETGELMKDYWVEIKNKTIDEARKIMFKCYGTKWSMQYDETDFDKSFFPKGCYEELGGNEDIQYSIVPITSARQMLTIINKI